MSEHDLGFCFHFGIRYNMQCKSNSNMYCYIEFYLYDASNAVFGFQRLLRVNLA